ncbi:MAG: Ig-like domain-containing protein [Nitrospirota bacterium]
MNNGRGQRGVTMIELLVVLGLVGLVAIAIYTVYLSFLRHYLVQTQVNAMQQNARIALDLMLREIRTTGYDPLGGIFSAGNPPVKAASSIQYQLQADLDEDGAIDADEDITYRFNANSLERRVGAAGAFETVAENIESMAFSYVLLDTTGAPVYSLDSNPSAGELGQIVTVNLRYTVRTAEEDPNWTVGDNPDTAPVENDGYRRQTVTTAVNLRNLKGGTANCGSAPGAPQNLQAADTPCDTGNSISLTWDKSADDGAGESDVSAYRVYRNTTGVGLQNPANQIAQVAANGTATYTYADSAGVANGTTYHYLVTAVEGCNPPRETPVASSASAAADDDRPAPAQSVLAYDTPCDTGQSLTVSWSKSADDGVGQNNVTTYRLYRRLASDLVFPNTPIGTVTATGALTYSFVDDSNSNSSSPPVDGTGYVYAVRAFAASCNLESAEALSAVATSTATIGPPTLDTATRTDAGVGQAVTLSWTPPGGAGNEPSCLNRYKIYRCAQNPFDTAACGSYSYVGQTASGSPPPTSFVDTLPGGDPNLVKKLCYTVTSVDTLGNESDQSNAQCTMPTCSNPPTLSITSPSDGASVSGSVTMTADATANGLATSIYQVSFSIAPQAGGPVSDSFIDTNGADGWSWTLNTSTLLNGVYTLTVQATDDTGCTRTQTITITVANSTCDVGIVDGSQDVFGLDYNKVTFQLYNLIGSDVTVRSMRVTWSGLPGGVQIKKIKVNGAQKWAGTQNSGVCLNVTDFTVAGTNTISNPLALELEFSDPQVLDNSTAQVVVDFSDNDSCGGRICSQTLTNSLVCDVALKSGSVVIGGGSGSKEVTFSIYNANASPVTYKSMRVDWSGAPGGTKIEEVLINNVTRWKHDGIGTPDGRQDSGICLNVDDFTISGATSGSPIPVKLKFNKAMTGTTVTVRFATTDGCSGTICVMPLN